MAKEKEVLKSVDAPTATPVTEFLDSSFDDSELDFGLENERRSLSQYPLLKLMQSLSPEVQDRSFPDIYAGTLVNDVTKACLGEKVEIRIMRTWRSRVKFPPREEGGSNIECSCPTYNEPGECGTNYGRCDSCEFNNFDVPNRCMPQYQIVAAIGDNPYDLVRIILSKTSYRAGSKLDRALRALGSKYRGKPVYMFKVMLSAEEVTNPRIGVKYFVYKLDVIPPVEGEPLLPPELEQEFKDVFLEVRDLRREAMEYHKAQVADKASQVSPVAGALGSSMASMSSDIMGSFGSSSDLASEEVPF